MDEMRDISQIEALNFLNLNDAVFSMGQCGFLKLEYRGKTYEKVTATRLLPFMKPFEYISIGDGQEEIGLIRSLEDVKDTAQRELISDELKVRYYTPEITAVKSTKEKVGYLYIEVDTDAGSKKVCISDVNSNVRQIGENRILIVDVDGNRYAISDLRVLDPKSRKRIEHYIY